MRQGQTERTVTHRADWPSPRRCERARRAASPAWTGSRPWFSLPRSTGLAPSCANEERYADGQGGLTARACWPAQAAARERAVAGGSRPLGGRDKVQRVADAARDESGCRPADPEGASPAAAVRVAAAGALGRDGTCYAHTIGGGSCGLEQRRLNVVVRCRRRSWSRRPPRHGPDPVELDPVHGRVDEPEAAEVVGAQGIDVVGPRGLLVRAEVVERRPP